MITYKLYISERKAKFLSSSDLGYISFDPVANHTGLWEQRAGSLSGPTKGSSRACLDRDVSESLHVLYTVVTGPQSILAAGNPRKTTSIKADDLRCKNPRPFLGERREAKNGKQLNRGKVQQGKLKGHWCIARVFFTI